MEKISFFGQFDPLPKCHLTMPTVARITAHRVPLNLGFLKSVSRRLYSPRESLLGGSTGFCYSRDSKSSARCAAYEIHMLNAYRARGGEVWRLCLEL